MTTNTQAAEALRKALKIFDWLERRSIYQDAEVAEAHAAVRSALATPQQAEPDEPLQGHVPHTRAGFEGAMIGAHNRMPTPQEVWDAAIRSFIDLHGDPRKVEPPAAADGLPKLPEPRTLSRGDEDGPIQLGYTADQMRAYAREVHELGRQQGMRQERALWNLTRSGEEIEAALAAKPAQEALTPAAGKWEGAEEWMPLAWELCANECGEEACSELIWEGGPIKEPWGDRWLKYEDQAKEMIAMVRASLAAAHGVSIKGDGTT